MAIFKVEQGPDWHKNHGDEDI